MRTIFFAPHSALWIHAFPDALIAEALAQEGNEIIYIGCNKLLKSYCIPMAAFSVSFEAAASDKSAICALCGQNEAIIRQRFGFRGFDLADLITDEDLLIADKLVLSITLENCQELAVEGIEVGRIALYEILIHNKKSELVFTSSEWQRYKASLRNCILVLRVMQKIFAMTPPDRVVVNNALYSVNRIVCRLAESNSIPQYFVHAGDNLSKRLQTLIIARGHAFDYYQHLRNKWLEIQQYPCALDAMKSATNHFLEVGRGKSVWAYSVASGQRADLRRQFDIKADRKVICATMSSSDERYSAEMIGALSSDASLIFPKQVDWIRALIRYIESRQDLSLIIRIHPREFPNKRENVLSEHAKMLQEALLNLPENVKVNWPTDNVSLYDLANITDVFANAWSSAGKEMAWLGLPVVLYSNELTIYPANLNYVGTTLEEYFQKLEQALQDGWDSEHIRRTYRWCALEYQYGALDISDSFSKSEVRSFIARATSRLLRSVKLSWEQKSDCRKRATYLRASGQINRIFIDKMNTALELDEMDKAVSYAQETEFLKKEVHRLVTGLYGVFNGYGKSSLTDNLWKFVQS